MAGKICIVRGGKILPNTICTSDTVKFAPLQCTALLKGNQLIPSHEGSYWRAGKAAGLAYQWAAGRAILARNDRDRSGAWLFQSCAEIDLGSLRGIVWDQARKMAHVHTPVLFTIHPSKFCTAP